MRKIYKILLAILFTISMILLYFWFMIYMNMKFGYLTDAYWITNNIYWVGGIGAVLFIIFMIISIKTDTDIFN